MTENTSVDFEAVCTDLFGVVPLTGDRKAGRIKLSWLASMFVVLLDDTIDDQINRLRDIWLRSDKGNVAELSRISAICTEMETFLDDYVPLRLYGRLGVHEEDHEDVPVLTWQGFDQFDTHEIGHPLSSSALVAPVKRRKAVRFSLPNLDEDQPISQLTQQMPKELPGVDLEKQRVGCSRSHFPIQKSPPSLALCLATRKCISTSESVTDLVHYAPPWNYNPEGREKPISKEAAREKLLEVVRNLPPPDKSTPRIAENRGDYLRVEYESPILGFWFPSGKGSVVEYPLASRFGYFDFDANQKSVAWYEESPSHGQFL
ncbi:hypothetical protein MLD38_011410 [Melastoma candidum]|uniref:Uncharacterized protein n=1 Tax=Melastoma candidum TaxID=119954 RepID=A0ACB9R317_9MYRT|nr:hypothetical protein MLD38_011410 [Melastoma candidum]